MTPTTAAGRVLLEWMLPIDRDGAEPQIAAIEAEAAAAERERLAGPVDHAALHDAVDRWRLADADAHHSLADEADYERRDNALAALRAVLALLEPQP